MPEPRRILCGLAIAMFGLAAATASGQPAARPSTSIESRVLAVHLTDFFPSDGYLRTPTEGRGRFGVTLHFSLGQPVIDHFAGNWSRRRFGILVPLSCLRNQILNLLAQDTFVLGDVRLPEDAVVVAPVSESIPENPPFRVIRYGPDENLRATIDATIARSGTLPFRAGGVWADAAVAVGDSAPLDREAFFALFRELLRDKPHVTRTTHDNTPWGAIDGIVSDHVGRWLLGKPLKETDTTTLRLALLAIEDTRIEVARVTGLMTLPDHARRTLTSGLSVLDGYVNLLHVEVGLRAGQGRSLLESTLCEDTAFRARVAAALPDRERLQSLAVSRLDQLKPVIGQPASLSPRDLGQALPYSGLEALKQRLAEAFPRPDANARKLIGQVLVTKAAQLLLRDQVSASAALAEIRQHSADLEPTRIAFVLGDMMRRITASEDDFVPPVLGEFFKSAQIRAVVDESRYYDFYANDPRALARLDRIFK